MSSKKVRIAALHAAVQLHARITNADVNDASRNAVVYTAKEFEKYLNGQPLKEGRD